MDRQADDFYLRNSLKMLKPLKNPILATSSPTNSLTKSVLAFCGKLNSYFEQSLNMINEIILYWNYRYENNMNNSYQFLIPVKQNSINITILNNQILNYPTENPFQH